MEAYDDMLEIYVRPYYLRLLHANFMTDSDDHEHFPAYLRLAASTVGVGRLRRMLRDRDWRPALTAGWFAGINSRNEFTKVLADRLSQTVGAYDEQGLCVGLGLIGGPVAQRALCDYLDRTLPCCGSGGNQGWALGALAYLESAPPQRYMGADLWLGAEGPEHSIREFTRVVEFLRSHRVIVTTGKGVGR